VHQALILFAGILDDAMRSNVTEVYACLLQTNEASVEMCVQAS
jgi:hypothetical protein